MIVRIAGVLSVSVMLVLLADVRPAMCKGWSLPNPFASETKTETKVKKPSVLDKVSAGTKKFFSQAAETLRLKKPEPKKSTPQYACPVRPSIHPRKKESKSWFDWLSRSEEPRGPKTVTEWMDNDRPE